MDLPDLNLWFALLVPEHPFHPEAQRYWGVAAEPVLVRVTALGLLRLLTNPKAMGGKPLEVGEAWRVYRELRGPAGVPVVEEPEGLEDALSFLVAQGFGYRHWSSPFYSLLSPQGSEQVGKALQVRVLPPHLLQGGTPSARYPGSQP